LDWILDARYSRDGTVRLWEAEAGKPIRRIVVAEDGPHQEGE